jgi:hypothetical protein
MANNIFGGQPNAVVCKTAVSFATAGINSGNTSIIYKVGSPLLSYVPGRSINGITGFEEDAGYYFVALTDMDLTAYVVPPTDAGIPPPPLLPHSSSFTGTDGTLLPAFVPEAGQAWVNEAGNWKIVGGRALPVVETMPVSGWVAKTDVGAADIRITAVVKMTTLASDIIQIGGRYTSATDQVLILINDGGITIYDIDGGGPTSLGAASLINNTADHTYEITMKVNAVTVKRDGTTIVTGTIAKPHTGTRVQMTAYAPGASTNVSYASFDVIAAP